MKRATDSYGGKGVWYYNPSELNINFNDIIANIESDIVIQKGIRQSATLSRLNESSVNTIRLISMLKRDGTVKIYSTILRMGIGNMKVDNATSGGITVGIQADGRLKSVAYNTNGIRLNEHPTSHVKFSDVIIPGFDKIQEAIHILHPQVPNFRLVSWDIAIDDMDRPIFIEANLCDGEIDFHQLNNGPLFGDDTESILSEVFRNK